ncbi:MAG: Gldg family protein, partial [Gemmatimonadota bacterium]|nr:Gldg family protein [Gemmatimonadota bacterium]
MMRRAWIVARRELMGFFDTPTAYVLAVAFLGLGLYMSFRSLYAMGVASLRPFFDLLPWLFVVFVPAVAMKALAEERRSRTLDWLVAQPLSESEIVMGKFIGNWFFVLITLAGTLPMALGVLFTSEADGGIMVAQYLGGALLAAQMIAIGLWASSITRNQITAFIVGAAISFTLILIGTPIVQIGLPRWLGSVANQLSVMGHFQNVARGVVDLRDILYFVSTCGLFLMLTVASLSRDRLSHARAEYRRLRTGTAVIVAGVLMLNLLGGYIRGRVDLTADNLFTLSDGSREILGNLDDIVNLKLFVSDELPQEIQLTLRDVRDLAADLRGASNGRLITEELNPDADEDAASEASSLGIFPIEFNVLRDDELQVRRGYFGLAVTYADEQDVIPVIDRTDDLEFRLVSAIRNMTSPRQPTVAFGTGFGAKDATQFGAFRQGISDRYRVSTVNLEPTEGTPIIDPDSVDILVIAAPATPMSGAAVAAIDGYVSAGGAAFLIMERHEINPQAPIATPITTGLEGFLSDRGVEATGELVFDAASSERISLGRQGIFNVIRAYAYWPIAFTGSEHTTIRDLGNLTFGWASPFTFSEDDPTIQPLWTTTEAGGVRPAGASIDPSMELTPTEEELGIFTMAVAIDPAAAEDAPENAGGRIVAIGDADFLEDRFVQANPQNLVFAANALDWLGQDEALIGIRSKNRTPPTLAFASDFGRNALKWGSLIGVPVAFVLFGIVRITGRTGRAERR